MAIDQLTRGCSVYCFVDACRTPTNTPVKLPDLGIQFKWGLSMGVQVFLSATRGMSSFWITELEQEAESAGCGVAALGTRAFLAALDSYGAEWTGSLPMPVISSRILEGSNGLIERWARHQGVNCGPAEGPQIPSDIPLLYTDKPMSVADVHKNAAAPHTCQAQLEGTVEPRGSGDAISSLVRRGFLKPTGWKLKPDAGDRLLTKHRYTIPIALHLAWCEWALATSFAPRIRPAVPTTVTSDQFSLFA